MRLIFKGKDRSVSEVIGTIFVFAIFIALLTTLVAWYIPSTETSADQVYEANMLNAMSEITSTLSNPNIPYGTQINQIFPTGIAGTVVSPSTPTSVLFSDSGFSENASYGVGLGFYYLNQHPTAGVLNKVVGTFPFGNISNPTGEFYCVSNHYLYVIGYRSNNMAIINTVTGTVVSFVYAGGNPVSMAFDPLNHYLYIADQEAIPLEYFGVTYTYYSTLSIVSTINNTYINSYVIPCGIVSPNSVAYGDGNIYISSGSSIVGINPQNFQTFSEVSNSYNVKELYFYNNGNNGVLVALNKGSDSYTVYGPNLILQGIYAISSIGSITLESISSGTSLFYLSFNATKDGGVITSLPCTTNVLSYTTFPKGVYAYNLTYMSGTTVAVITHNASKDNDAIVEECYDAVTSSLREVGSLTSATGLNYICYNDNVDTGSGISLGLLIVINFNLDYELMVRGSPSNGQLKLYSTIYDNYFISPYDSLYDQNDNLLYFSNYCTGTISVISPINQSLLSVISLGPNAFPTYMALNSSSGLVYVLESGNSSIAILNGLSLYKINPSILLPAGCEPRYIAYDPSTQDAYVMAESEQSSTIAAHVLRVSGFSAVKFLNETGDTAGYISFDAYNNQTYGIFCKGTTYLLYDINSKSVILNLDSSGTSGRYYITFDSLDGYMFAIFSSGCSYGMVQVYTPAFTLYQIIRTGYDPSGVVFDGGNSLIYVSNYCSTNGDNLTVINAENFTILTTIWIGSGPENPAFDSQNGYIYIPDNLSDKVTVIDGGFTVYKGKPGVLESDTVNSGGLIEAYGATQFTTPVQYFNEGGFLLENYSNPRYDNIVGSLPISVTNQSGDLFFNFVDTGFSMPGVSTSKVVSSTSPTDARLQVSNKVDSSYYVGDEFYLSDVFGNQYIAVVTGVFLEYFSLTIHTSFSPLLNKFLYGEYNGTADTVPTQWFFSSIPMQVKLSGSQLSFSLISPVEFYSVSILFYDISVEGL